MLEITKYPSPILKKKAQAVPEITEGLRQLISQMEEAMYEHDGIGLAAPQIGRSQQIFLVETAADPRKATRGGTGHAHAFLNPEITFKSKKQEVDEEGCLSLPGLFVPVKRSASVTVKCQTLEGKLVVIKAEGLAARIFQHEIDHLLGKLIIDRISPVQRLKIRKQLKEIKDTGQVQSL